MALTFLRAARTRGCRSRSIRNNGSRATQFLNGTARLKPGVSMAQAQDAMNGLALGLASAYPDTNAGKSVELFDLKEQINGDAPRLIVILSAAIAAVLLIACLNVASLLTVRASMRGAELAVRTALGATGRRLRRQLMVEHLLLAAGGGALAIPLGLALHRAIVEQRLLNLPRTATAFGWEPVAALAVLVLTIGAVLARIAIRRTSSVSASSTLLGLVRHTGSRGSMRLRQGLVIAEVAATLLLLVTAGLMLESARRLSSVDPGFRTDNVLTFGVVLPGHAYMEASTRLSFANRVVEGLKSLPGVRNATVGAYAPMGDMRGTRRFARADQPPPVTGQEPVALDLPVGADYFSVMGIEVKAGRSFTDRDGPRCAAGDDRQRHIRPHALSRRGRHRPADSLLLEPSGRHTSSNPRDRRRRPRRPAGRRAPDANPADVLAVCAELLELRQLLRSG